jgi:hypothetical protein
MRHWLIALRPLAWIPVMLLSMWFFSIVNPLKDYPVIAILSFPVALVCIVVWIIAATLYQDRKSDR